MSNSQPPIGAIAWCDLTIENAVAVKDFYKQVAGWTVDEADMGGYSDFVMNDGDDEPIAGICHAKGSNAGLPASWLIYITVENLDESMAACQALGGKILVDRRDMGGYGTMCVIEDPAGAVAALIQPPN